MRRRRGFTLFEWLVVIAVGAALAALLLLRVSRTRREQEMKEMTLRRAFALILLLDLVTAASGAYGQDPEPPPEAPITLFTGSFQERGPTLNGVHTGTAFVTLNYVPFTVTSVSKLLAFEQRADGTVLRTVGRLLAFGPQGDLWIVTREALTPIAPARYRLSATVQVLGGFGQFEIAHGEAIASGMVQVGVATVSTEWQLDGAFYFF